MAIDGDTAQVGPEVAGQLDIPQVTCLAAIEQLTTHGIVVSRKSGTCLQRMEIELPCAVMVSRENGELSCMTLSGWRRAQQQEIFHWNEKDMGIDVSSVGLHASPTRVVSTAVPVRKKEIKWCTGAADFAEAIRI